MVARPPRDGQVAALDGVRDLTGQRTRSGFPRLALGTVQLGLDYGRIVAERAPNSQAAANAVLDAAWQAGIRCFDTAEAYGLAQPRIGVWSEARGYAPQVIAKVKAIPDGDADAGDIVLASIACACTDLRRARLETVLLHRAADMLRKGAVEALVRATAAGAISRWGVSIYTAAEFERALTLPGIGAIEAPVSALDRRLETAGLLARAAAGGVAVIARSVFLQGVLLTAPERVPSTVPGLRIAVTAFAAQAKLSGMHPGTLAIASVAAMTGIDTLVLGAAQACQVRDIANWANAARELTAPPRPLPEAGALNSSALDPRAWPL